MCALSRLSFAAFLTFAMGGAACTENSKNNHPEVDAGPVWTGVQVDVGFDSFRSGVKSDSSMTIQVRTFGIDREVVKQHVRDSVRFVRRDSRKDVPGTWSFGLWGYGTHSFTAQFAATGGWKEGDYLVLIEPSEKVRSDIPMGVFNVGGVPRVARIQPNYAGDAVTGLAITFSVPVKLATARAGITATTQAAGAAKAVSFGPSTQTATELSGLVLPLQGTVLAKDRLTLTFPLDIGAVNGKLLDGKYDGNPGSGPLTVTLIPAEHDASKQLRPWEPWHIKW